jgi:hypothetical protein
MLALGVPRWGKADERQPKSAASRVHGFPGPDGQCQFVDMESPDGISVSAGEWRQRQDGYVELVVPSLPISKPTSPPTYTRPWRSSARTQSCSVSGSYGDTLSDEYVLLWKKDEQDMHLFECLAFMSRRQG